MTTETAAPIPAEQLTDLVADYALDKKAIDVVSLDLRGVSGIADTFLICSGNTDRQVKAIHDAIHFGLKKEHGTLPRRTEGAVEARWVLMDYFDIVVHILTPEAREFYRLEQLWGDAPRRVYEPGPDAPSPVGGAAEALRNDRRPPG